MIITYQNKYNLKMKVDWKNRMFYVIEKGTSAFKKEHCWLSIREYWKYADTSKLTPYNIIHHYKGRMWRIRTFSDYSKQI